MEPVHAPYVIVGQYRIKPEMREEFLKSAHEGLQATIENETGVLSFHVAENIYEKNTFFYVEEWKSEEAMRIHFNAHYIIKLFNTFPKYFLEPPIVKVYHVSKTVQGLKDYYTGPVVE